MIWSPKSAETKCPHTETGRTALHNAINRGLILLGAGSAALRELAEAQRSSAGSGPALGTRGVFMPSAALVCGRIHRGQVDVLALNEHLCAAGMTGRGKLLGCRAEQFYTLI